MEFWSLSAKKIGLVRVEVEFFCVGLAMGSCWQLDEAKLSLERHLEQVGFGICGIFLPKNGLVRVEVE